MKRAFVKTANSKMFRSSIAEAQARGARESSLVAVTGRPGEGKSHTLNNWASEFGAAILTAQVDWTPRRMLLDLAEKLLITPTSGFERRMEAVIAAKDISIIVDEAGFTLANNAICLERLRSITDKSSTLLVLVFMPHDITRLDVPRLKQLRDRISTTCEFKKSTLDDVAMACAQLTDVLIAPDLAANIHTHTDGCMRLVLNAIARVEGEARLRPADQSNTPMSLADIKGLDLFKGLGRAGRKGAAA